MWQCKTYTTSECDWGVKKAHGKTGGSHQNHHRWQYGKQENNIHHCCTCTGSTSTSTVSTPFLRQMNNLLGAGLAQTESLLHTLLYLYCKAQSKDRWPEFCMHLHAMDFIVQRSVAARSTSFLSSSLSLSLSISLAFLLFHSLIHSLYHSLVLAPSNSSVCQFSNWL